MIVDRALVDQPDLHPGAEPARAHRRPSPFELAHDPLDQGLARWGGAAWTNDGRRPRVVSA